MTLDRSISAVHFPIRWSRLSTICKAYGAAVQLDPVTGECFSSTIKSQDKTVKYHVECGASMLQMLDA
jgi:hypothetical protein